jgi:hypothetical protein
VDRAAHGDVRHDVGRVFQRSERREAWCEELLPGRDSWRRWDECLLVIVWKLGGVATVDRASTVFCR